MGSHFACRNAKLHDKLDKSRPNSSEVTSWVEVLEG